MKIVYGKQFLHSAGLLPRHLQKKLDTLVSLLELDAFHPLLHTKPLAGELKGWFSFRITRDWRAIFYFMNERTIQLSEVAHRKDIYR